MASEAPSKKRAAGEDVSKEDEAKKARAPGGSSLNASLTTPHPAQAGTPASMRELWSVDDNRSLGYMNHTILWVKTKDMEATAKFYLQTLGLQLSFRWESMWLEVVCPGGVVLGFEEDKDWKGIVGDHPGFSVCLGVKSVSATKAALESRGVEFNMPSCIGGPVLLQPFVDPVNGYHLALLGTPEPAEGEEAKEPDMSQFKSAVTPDPAVKELDGKASWPGSDPALGYNCYGNVTLKTKDMEVAHKFWTETLGCITAWYTPKMWCEVVVPGNWRIGFDNGENTKTEPTENYFVAMGCRHVDLTKGKLVARGVTFGKPQPPKMMLVHYFTDPDDNHVGIVGSPATAAGPKKDADECSKKDDDAKEEKKEEGAAKKDDTKED